jgi:hypothetical protein
MSWDILQLSNFCLPLWRIAKSLRAQAHARFWPSPAVEPSIAARQTENPAAAATGCIRSEADASAFNIKPRDFEIDMSIA